MPRAVWGRLRHHVAGILAATACWAGMLLLLTATPIRHAILDWENRTVDYRFQLRGTVAQDPRIVLVDIDDRSLEAIGRWPWERTYHAKLIEALSQSGAAVIGYDILFEHRARPDEDRALADAIARAGNVYLPTGFELTQVEGAPLLSVVREVGPFTEVRTAAAGVAHISSNRDPDGTIRRVPVVVDAEGLTPALSLAMAAGYLRSPIDRLAIEAGRVILPAGDGLPHVRDHAAHIPVDDSGMMIVNYPGTWEETFQHVSFADVLDAWQTPEGRAALAGIVGGKICLVSNTGSGFDLKPTPFERGYPGGGIHASALNTILTGRYLSGLPGWASAGVTVGLAVMTAAIVAMSPWWFALAASGLLMAVFLGVAVFAFHQGMIVPVVLPMLGVVSASALALVMQNRLVAARVGRLTEERTALAARVRDAAEALRQGERHLADARNELSEARTEVDGLRLETREQVERVGALEAALDRATRECEALQSRKRMLEDRLNDLLIQPVRNGGTGDPMATVHREWAQFGVITRNLRMRELFERTKRAASTRHPVLITGETGTGKELVAHAIHRMSDRRQRPFVTVNIPALQDNLVESELFGHTKGAFTGAVGDKKGKFQSADGGTIFLDEIGEMRGDLQAKLLRVLESGAVDRVGALSPDSVDVRIIAATNRDVQAMVDRGTFRSDLYFRLRVMTVDLPPLRERPDDLDILIEYFLDRYASESSKPLKGLTVKAMARLKAHPWPGNVRELEHAIARAVALSPGDRITESDLEMATRTAALGTVESDTISGGNLSDAEFLALLRKNLFEIGTISDQLRISRGTVGLRFKGICFRVLAENDGDHDKAAAVLCNGESSTELVRKRIEEYHSNLIEVLHQFETTEQAREGCRRRFKNLPHRYWEGLDALIIRYFDQLAAKS